MRFPTTRLFANCIGAVRALCTWPSKDRPREKSHSKFSCKASLRLLRHSIDSSVKSSLPRGSNHPHIISILHSGQSLGGQQFYVMDYVRGLPFDRYVREHQLDLKATLKLFANVCRAVSHAHQKGVIHRDLKPSNILVDSEGQPRIVDFGLAKMLAGPENLAQTVTGSPLGTLAFMSPEQARGNPDEIDTRADVYALGIILYTALTGSFPYPVHVAMADILGHITDTQPRRPSKVWTAEVGVKSGHLGHQRCPLDEEVETIVLKAIAKEPDRRYQFAGDFARDVERYLAGEPIEAKGDSLSYKLSKVIRRHRLAAAALAGYLLLVTAALLVALWSRHNVIQAKKNEADQRLLAEQQQRTLDQENRAYVDSWRHLAAAMRGLANDAALPAETRLMLLQRLGDAESLVSNYAEAKVHWQAAVQLAEQHLTERAQVMPIKHQLAQLLLRAGDFSAAEAVQREVLEWRQSQTTGSESDETIEAKTNLAQALRYQGKHAAAEELYHEVLDYHQNQDHQEFLTTAQNNLASLYWEQARYQEAIPLLEQALSCRAALLAKLPEDASIQRRHRLELKLLTTQNNLAGNYTMVGEFDKAEPLVKEAVVRGRVVLPPDDDRLAYFLLTYGRLLVKTKRYAAAEPLLEESLRINVASFGKNHKWTKEVVETLIELYTSWGRPEKAKQYYRDLTADSPP